MAEDTFFFYSLSTTDPLLLPNFLSPKLLKNRKSSHSSTRTKPSEQSSFHHHDQTKPPPIPPSSRDDFGQDHMLSTPLPDYRHSANQTAKTRAALEATRHAQRKSSSTADSATIAARRHALKSAAAAAASSTTHELVRSDSGSSASANSSGLTAVTTNDASRRSDDLLSRPFTKRNGRRYLRDASLPYPLPVDLGEIHRQTLRTVLLSQVFNGPFCSPALAAKPPKRVLEVGCGTALWSVLCHRHFSQRGFTNISFTGMDVAPLSKGLRESEDMNWHFVQHDIRNLPLPFRNEEFGMIMLKDMSLVTQSKDHQVLMDEYLRILKPGGTLEIWDGDHTLRMLLPHTRVEEEDAAAKMGIYNITPQTPFAAPQNTHLNEFNGWMTRMLDRRGLSAMPCTEISPILIQEAETLVEIDSRRLAIPLGDVRWEREGLGPGAVTTGKSKEGEKKRSLTEPQKALRRTALMTVTQMIESLEPALRESSGKGQDEWDRWMGSMMSDLLNGNGTTWGECLEVGAWWARKKKVASAG